MATINAINIYSMSLLKLSFSIEKGTLEAMKMDTKTSQGTEGGRPGLKQW